MRLAGRGPVPGRQVLTTAHAGTPETRKTATMASENTKTLTDGDFEQAVLQSDRPVLVDFWAEWCGPCRMIAPAVDALADEYNGRAVVGKLNIDDNPATPEKYSVRSIPTLLLFKGGEVVESTVGVAGKDKLAELLDRHV